MNPNRKIAFVDFARGSGEYRMNGTHVDRRQPQAIDGQDHTTRQESGAVVTVNRQMDFDEAKKVLSSDVHRGALRPIREAILWPETNADSRMN